MFHQFKITSYAFILCLFGLTLMTASPVFAQQTITPPCLTLEQCRDEVTQMGERVADLLAQVGVVLTDLQSKAEEAHFSKSAFNIDDGYLDLSEL